MWTLSLAFEEAVMPEVVFNSLHPKPVYNCPAANAKLRFENYELRTSNEQAINYLRGHKDFGVKVFEGEKGRAGGAMSVPLRFCPVPGCGKAFREDMEFFAHVINDHPGVKVDAKGKIIPPETKAARADVESDDGGMVALAGPRPGKISK